MERSPSQEELTVMHQFDRLCQLTLDGEAANYYRHMEYRRDHEVNFSEMTEKELDSIFVMDEYDLDTSHFQVLGSSAFSWTLIQFRIYMKSLKI